MTRPISLVRMCPDVLALSQWALQKGYLEAGCSDMGYALHAATKWVFTDFSIRPFVLRTRQSRQSSVELLGYVDQSAKVVSAGLESTSRSPGCAQQGEIARMLNLGDVLAKDMPKRWEVGQRLSFEVRVRPVVRSRLGRFGGSREIDIAAWVARRGERSGHDKNDLYLQWLDSRLRLCGARLCSGRVNARGKTVVLRRPRKQGKRELNLCNGPDVVMSGLLEVQDSDLFAEGLIRGVGRHTGFGFGCLLLAPLATAY